MSNSAVAEPAPAQAPAQTSAPKPPTPRAYVYFAKQLPNIPVIAGGGKVGWEVLDGQQGRARFNLATDAAVIKDLRALAARNSGGVTEISEAQYEDLKKNHPYRPTVRQSEIQPIPSRVDFLPKPIKRGAPAAAVKAVAESAGVPVTTVPKPSVTPPPGPAPETPPAMGMPSFNPTGGGIQAALPPAPSSPPWHPPTENPESTVVNAGRPTVGRIRTAAPAKGKAPGPSPGK
jgi:hypothetical protein